MVRIDKRRAALVAVAAIVATGITIGGLALAGAFAGAGAGTVSVTGTGTVTGTPDTLSLDLAVSTNASSATAALVRNNAEMTRLQRVFEKAGVPLSDLQTSDLSVSPNYGPNNNITGYNTEDDLTVTLHHIGRAGAVIDAAAQSVGNDIQISDLSFSISDTSSLLARARTAAMQQAHIEASDIANGAGVPLGVVEHVTDTEQESTPPPLTFSGLALPSAAKSSVPVQAGTQQLSVQVQVVYALGS
jgi:uncharacterized protein